MSKPGKICFICGEPGANTIEHVISRCFLPKGSPGTQRFTLPPHRKCNESFSLDEEYVRDLIGPTTTLYPEGRDVFERTQRSWSKPQGRRLLNRLLSNSWLEDLRSPAGLVIGTSVAIKFELHRLQRVGQKIAQGVVFRDTNNFIKPNDLIVAPIPSAEVPKERNLELARGNLSWQLLVSDDCTHTNYSDSIAVRRAYSPLRAEPMPACIVVMLIMIYSQTFFVTGEIEFIRKPPDGFIILALKEAVEPATDPATAGGAYPRRSSGRLRPPLIGISFTRQGARFEEAIIRCNSTPGPTHFSYRSSSSLIRGL
jgi:hypothetical protein